MSYLRFVTITDKVEYFFYVDEKEIIAFGSREGDKGSWIMVRGSIERLFTTEPLAVIEEKINPKFVAMGGRGA